MTSTIESDRFEAKCASGSTYIVVEKTKEFTESGDLSEQTFVTSQKSYFLSTGEEVKKISDEDYLIINNKKIITRSSPKPRKPKIFHTTDIKTIFDYLKNQALCIAIVLAIPETLTILEKNKIAPLFMIATFAIATSMAIVFSVTNLIWLFSTLEKKQRYWFLDMIGIVGTLAFTLGVMAVVTLKVSQGVTIFIQLYSVAT